MNHERRRVLNHCASTVTVAALGLPALGAMAAAEEAPSAGIDVHIELRAVQDQVAIRAGAPTRVWRYQGRLLRGAAGTLGTWAGNYLGPIIRVRRGQRVRIDLINELPESTIIHWHGLHVPDTMDGHPRFAIAPGERYVYDFRVVNRAGSYWFHPHPHGRTGRQVYFGMAGLFLVSDDEEAGQPSRCARRRPACDDWRRAAGGLAAPRATGFPICRGHAARTGAGRPEMDRRHAASRRAAHRRERPGRRFAGTRPAAVLTARGAARLLDRHGGCENRGIHRSNLQCFEDEMAMDCPVCLGTAEMAYQMSQKGITDAAKIQAAVDARWRPRR